MRVPVRIIRVPFLIPTWALAQVPIPRIILIRKDVSLNECLLAHELVHVKQWERRGWVFPLQYLSSHLKYGYAMNPFEREASAAQELPEYKAWAKELLATRP